MGSLVKTLCVAAALLSPIYGKIYFRQFVSKFPTQNFDTTTIADQLRTVSWRNNSHPTGVVKAVSNFIKTDSVISI